MQKFIPDESTNSTGVMGLVDNFGRKRFLVGLALGLAVLATVLGLAIGIPLSRRSADTGDLQRAIEILEKYPLIDGHNDLPWQMKKNAQNQLASFNLGQDLRTIWNNSHTDIPRLLEGKLGAQFWAAYVPCSTTKKDAVRLTLEQIDVIHRFVNQYSSTFTFVRTADEIEAAFKDKKIGSMIGVEGGHSIDNSLATLRLFYDLGVRYMTLTHSCDLPWADMWNETGSLGGLSPFGEKVVLEMNRLGMLVDLAHVSADTMRHTLRITRSPIIYSHSSAFALCPHKRNVPDDVLRLTATNHGVVMVNFYNTYISCSDKANLTQVADHIDYIKNVAGVDYVGIGADYDGVELVPEGLEDVSKFPALFAELLRRGWSEEDLGKLAGGNLLRVLRANELVKEQSANMDPYEDLIPQIAVADYSACRSAEKV